MLDVDATSVTITMSDDAIRACFVSGFVIFLRLERHLSIVQAANSKSNSFSQTASFPASVTVWSLHLGTVETFLTSAVFIHICSGCLRSAGSLQISKKVADSEVRNSRIYPEDSSDAPLAEDAFETPHGTQPEQVHNSNLSGDL